MVDKFYKIGEVSKMLDLPASTLRYWENQFKQLKPVKSTGGQRFYTSKHIYLLEQLKDMLHNERYTIEGAKQRLKEIIANKENIDFILMTNKMIMKKLLLYHHTAGMI